MSIRIWYLVFAGIVFLSSCKTKEKKPNVTGVVTDSAAANTGLQQDTTVLQKEFSAPQEQGKSISDSVLLKFNYQKGHTYNHVMNVQVNQNRGDKNASSMMRWSYDMEVVDTKGDVKTIKTTYKRIDMTMDMGDQNKMEFSSEKEVDAMDLMQFPSRIFRVIKGKSFLLQINEKGDIISVDGFDKLGEDVVKEMSLPAEMKPMILQTFNKQFNDDAVKDMFTQWVSIFPGKRVKTGDSWKRNTSVSALDQSSSTVYKVSNIKGIRVFVTAESKVTSAQSNGTQSGQFIIDSRTGLIIDGLVTQKSGGPEKTVTRTRITGKQL